jgi:flagellar basal body-associated protein FliL
MNSNSTLLAVLSSTASQLLNFAIMAGLFLLVAVGTLVWFFFLRKKTHRRRKRHSQRRRLNPTRSQVGGLPPVREQDPSFGETPPPP